MNELAVAWVDRYGEEAANDLEVTQKYGLAPIPYNMVIENEANVIQIVGGIQARLKLAANLRSQCEDEISRIEREAERAQERYNGQLEHYTRTHMHGKSKNIKVCTGHGGTTATMLGFRNKPGGLRIVDKEKAVEWAKECLTDGQAAVFVKRQTAVSPVADSFKAYFKDTGEIPAGCEVVPDDERFYCVKEGK